MNTYSREKDRQISHFVVCICLVASTLSRVHERQKSRRSADDLIGQRGNEWHHVTLEHQEAVETLLSATDLRRRGLTAIHHCRPGVWVLRLSMAATTPSLSSDPKFVIHKRRGDDRKECVFLSLFHIDTNTKNSSARTHAHMYKYTHTRAGQVERKRVCYILFTHSSLWRNR